VDHRTDRALVATGSPDGGGQVQVRDLHTGVLLASVPLPTWPAGLAVDQSTGHVFVVGSSPQVTMLDARRGVVLATIAVPGAASAVAVDERTGRAFVAAAGVDDLSQGTQSVLDTYKGRLLRTVAVETYPELLAVDEPAGCVLLTGVDAQGRGLLRLFDARSGRPMRTLPLPATATAWSLAAWGGQAFLLAAGTPYPLPAATATDAGAPYPLPATATASGLAVVDERTGTPRRAMALASGRMVLAAADQAGQVVVAGADARNPTAGCVSLLDAARGTLLSSRHVAGDPVAAAVAGPGGRVVVASGPALVAGPLPWWQPWLPRSLGRWLPRLAPQPSALRFVAGTLSLVDVAQP
jgi:hypothetical protein